jgi:titin
LTEEGHEGNQVTISFSAPSNTGGPDIDFYRVFIAKMDDNGNYNNIPVVESEETTVVLTNLVLQSTYKVQVAAVNSEGEGIKSDALIVETESANPPDAVEDLSVDLTEDQLSLTWSAPFNGGAAITSYMVQIETVGGELAASNNCQPLTQRSCSFNVNTLKSEPWNLDEADEIVFKVCAINSEGEGEVASANTFMPEKPEAPSSLEVSEFETNQVTVSWVLGDDGANPIKEQTVHVFDEDGEEIQSITVAADAESHVIDELVKETNYKVAVSASNFVFSSEPSSEEDFVTAGKPGQPSDLTVDDTDSDSISLSWVEPHDGHSPITSYKVYVEEQDGDDFITHNPVVVEDSSATLDLTPATSWRFTVSATNANGESDESESVEAATDERAPDAPTDLTLETTTSTSVGLSWTAPEEDGGQPVTQYHVHVFNEFNEEHSVRNTDDTVTVIDQLDSETLYHFTVSAVNSLGEGVQSDAIEGTTDEAPKIPPTPVNLALQGQAQSNMFTVSWNDGFPASDFPTTVYNVHYAAFDSDLGEYGEERFVQAVPPQKSA